MFLRDMFLILKMYTLTRKKHFFQAGDKIILPEAGALRLYICIAIRPSSVVHMCLHFYL